MIGASISGMLISKLLAARYEKIVILEKRKAQGDSGCVNKEVPQAQHVHLLLNKGLNEIKKILPGIEDDLLKVGGIHSNSTENWISHFPLGKFPNYKSKLDIVCVSRALLERTIRQRILREEQEKIQIIYNANVINYSLSEIENPKVEYEVDQTQYILETDLLIDASGQQSRAGKILQDQGYGIVKTENINPKLGYASRKYKDIAFEEGKHGILVMPKDPETPRGGVVFPIENNEYMVTLYGFDKEQPINEDFEAFAKTLNSKEIYQHIINATPLTETKQYIKKESHYRKYHRLGKWPKGYLVVGDAVCSFNPIYGQGITSAAMSLNNIQTILSEHEPTKENCKIAQKKIDKTYFIPWMIAKNEDLRWDSTEGANKTYILALMHRFMNRVMRLAAKYPDVTEAFIGILHMAKSPLELAKPKVARYLIKG